MKKLIIAALLLGLSGQSMATDWYILDAGNYKCLNAAQLAQSKSAPNLATPYAFRRFARQSSHYDGTKVYHVGDGQLAVDISLGGRHMDYFSSLAACQSFKKYITAHGHHAANLNELK